MAQATAPEVRGAQVWTLLALPIAAAIALILYRADALAQDEPPRLLPISQAAKPAFTLDDSNRQTIALNDLRGQTVLVHFFATWCEPCRVELPALRRLAERAGAIRILAISVAEPEARVRNFLDKMPPGFPILLDRDRAVAKAWNVSALPTTYILDGALQPRLFIESDYPWDTLDVPTLESLLSSKSTSSKSTWSSNGGEQHAVSSP